jgi:assimilatory nitrate reductase catalytic subunit
VLVSPDGGVAGDPEHPANFGRLCSKGAALGETLGIEGRLLVPLIGGERASWDAALDVIAATFRRVIEQHGPQAVALYGSGQFLTEDYYVANKLMKGFIGSANIDTNSRLCMASTVAGQMRAFGEDLVPGCYEDLEQADLVVLVGSNAAWCHPVLFQRIAAAKERRPELGVAVIDPRRTATCEIADLHLQLRPGSDVALFAGLLVHLAQRGAVDADWITAHTKGFAATLEAAQATAPSLAAVAAATDLSAHDITAFYARFTATERTVTLTSQGVNQSSAGTDKVNAIINCHLATGRIGRPGMGPFSLTGQPNAMGGREVGGLANQLAAHLSFSDPGDIDRLRRFWRAPELATAPGLKAIELFDAVHNGRIRALWVLGTNPAASVPRADRVRAALAGCEFVVVSDCWETDTTRLADVVLPAAGWGEKDGTVTNSERRISRQRAFRGPPGEARPDWWALCEVARRLGWGDAFAWCGPAGIFREHAALSGFENDGRRRFDIGGLASLDDVAYDALPPVQWPLPAGGISSGTARLLHDGVFPTEDGRARCIPTLFRPPATEPDSSYPLRLNTGRLRDQWHTMTRTGLVPRLATHTSEPLLDVHPADATFLGLTDSALCQIASEHGAARLRVRLTDDQRRGEVFAAMHWTDQHTNAGPIDRVVGALVDPVSGQPELKATPVAVAPIEPLWRGFLLRQAATPRPEGEMHWSRVPIDAGHAWSLSGITPPPGGDASEKWVTRLLDAEPGAQLMIYADPRRGIYRYAHVTDGRLHACLFLARDCGSLPEQETLAAQLGRAIGRQSRAALLAGIAPGATGVSLGPVVCACFVVRRQALIAAIHDGLGSVAEIGAALHAGTNCGSCIPELRQLLRVAASA